VLDGVDEASWAWTPTQVIHYATGSFSRWSDAPARCSGPAARGAAAEQGQDDQAIHRWRRPGPAGACTAADTRRR